MRAPVSVCACVCGVLHCELCCRLTDRFLRWMKLILLCDLILSSASISVAALQCLQVLPAHKGKFTSSKSSEGSFTSVINIAVFVSSIFAILVLRVKSTTALH